MTDQPEPLNLDEGDINADWIKMVTKAREQEREQQPTGNTEP
jgi:hypothetical protein